MNTFPLKVLEAEEPFYEGECLSLVFPTLIGLSGIQAGHSDMIAAVCPGMMKITKPDGEVLVAAVSDGMVKVENGDVLILVDTAERPEEIDEKRSQLAMEEAREAMLQRKSIQDYNAAQARMARAINRLRVKNLTNVNH